MLEILDLDPPKLCYLESCFRTQSFKLGKC